MDSKLGRYLVFTSIGFELVGLIVGSYFLSEYLDKTYDSRGMIFIGLAFGSLLAWLIRIVWLLRRFQKQDEASESLAEKSPQDCNSDSDRNSFS